jgi:hypothetical protein
MQIVNSPAIPLMAIRHLQITNQTWSVLVVVSFANLVILVRCDDAAAHSGPNNIWMRLIEMEGHTCRLLITTIGDVMVQAAQ